MAGSFIEGVSQALSGVYTLIRGLVTSAKASVRGIVAYPFSADWGPINVLRVVVGSTDFNTTYNGAASALTALRIHTHAFKSNPLKLLCYRMATGTAARGSAVLPNVGGAGTPWTLRTLHESARSFVAVVSTGVAPGAVRIQITEGGVIRYDQEHTTIAGLVAQLNASAHVRVFVQGTALPANTAGIAFTGGNNGSVSTSTEYAAFLTNLEADGTANSFALDGVTDEAIITVADTWVRRVRGDGVYITFVRGGLSTWDADLSLGTARAVAANYRGIIVVGNGCDGYTAAEMAIFVAAYVAAIPLNQGITDQVVNYTAVNTKLALTKGARTQAKANGLLLFVTQGDAVVIDEGVNSLTVPSGAEKKDMGKIRVNNALDAIAEGLETLGAAYKMDKSNTQEAREAFASMVEQTYLKGFAKLGIIQTGFTYIVDPDHHGPLASLPAALDEAFFFGDITPVDSMERMYQKITVRLSA